MQAQLAKLPASADAGMRAVLLSRAAKQSLTIRNTRSNCSKRTPRGSRPTSAYVAGFSENVQDISVKRFEVLTQIKKLNAANQLYLIVSKFTEIDLHPDAVSNLAMGYIVEELIRRLSEASNETAGEHFTPREVIRLMVNLLLCEEATALTAKGIIQTIYDPACGTSGMLSVAEEYLRELNPSAKHVSAVRRLEVGSRLLRSCPTCSR